MDIYNHPDFDGHEQVSVIHDAKTGLKGVIAIHSTALGPAAGGCRMWPYTSLDDAIADALRLSRGMTYKNAAAGLDLGGGKAVIIANPKQDKTPALMQSFGRFVNRMGGDYWTAEDVGVDVRDMERVHDATPYVAGLASGEFASGDPSPVTARGVFNGIVSAVRLRLNRTSLEGLRVAVQGAGHVGQNLCRLLHEAGAELTITDIDADRCKTIIAATGALPVKPDAIYAADVDVFAPCAMGGVLNERTIPLLRARIVAGAANNQLARPEHATMVQRAGILYVPDFVINCGGIINVAREISKIRDEGWVERTLAQAGRNLEQMLADSIAADISPVIAAEAFARRRLDATRSRPVHDNQRKLAAGT